MSQQIQDREGEGDGSFSFRASNSEAPLKDEPVSVADVTLADKDPAADGQKDENAAKAEKKTIPVVESNLPEAPRPDDQRTMLTNFKKNQQYYNDLELNMEDLDKIEERVQEMERYLGIEGVNDIQYFIRNDIEKLD